MSLPYETLTPILGNSATEHTPESETTPDFMNGKFNELLENDKNLSQQINVLSKYVYSTTDDPDLLDNGFWYCRGEKNPTNDIYCIECRKTPINGYAYQIAIYPFVASLIYVRRQVEGTWSEWCQIATTDKTDELTQQIEDATEKITRLEEQVKAASDQQDFYENCIVEMAKLVYA